MYVECPPNLDTSPETMKILINHLNKIAVTGKCSDGCVTKVEIVKKESLYNYKGAEQVLTDF